MIELLLTSLKGLNVTCSGRQGKEGGLEGKSGIQLGKDRVVLVPRLCYWVFFHCSN